MIFRLVKPVRRISAAHAVFSAPRTKLAAAAYALLLIAVLGESALALGAREPKSAPGGQATLRIVAAENFWGDIALQIGGSRVRVTSVLSDPNIDPHEYESSVKDAIAVANSMIAIESGGGYDGWMDKLLSASPSRSRIVISGADLAVTKLPDNVHVWYNVDNAVAVAGAIRDALVKLDPGGAADYSRGFDAFRSSLGEIRARMAAIKAKYAGAPIGLTETIFLYQALPMGLRVLTPFAFQKSIAEGNDPPAAAALTAEDQITQREVRVLVYNAQTLDPITRKMQSDAQRAGIPAVAVTETMPSGLHYQTWLLDQLARLQQALGG